MSGYYPTAHSHHSHHSHNPIMFGAGHSHSHISHGVPMSSHTHHTNHDYYNHPTTYGGDNVVYVPTHSSRSHRGHQRTATVVPATSGTVVYADGGGRHHRQHRSRHSHGHGHSSHRDLTFFERIRRFFGMKPKSRHYKVKGNTSSWGFLGRSRRTRYRDARTGGEVDRKGRPIYRV